ncbi:phage major capsid protein [Bacillus sp. FSL W7-1360]
MGIKFETFNEKKQEFAEAMQNGDEQQQTRALVDMIDALSTDVRSDILNRVEHTTADMSVLQQRGINALTSEETRYFSEVIENGGFKDHDTLLKTTQERIFNEVTESHPLLSHLGIQNLGAVTEYIYSDPTGAAVWGPIFGDIQGTVNTSFRKESISQLKLTAFMAVSNDMLKLGPVWVERYVRTMLVEVMKVGLERGYVAGTGKNEPIGLLKDIAGGTNEAGEYSDKKAAGTLTFEPGRTAINEMRDVIKNLSIRKFGDEEKVRNVSGKVVMVVNPFDAFDIKANATIQTPTGAYVTNMPFNPTITESTFVPQGKVLFFVKGEYIAATGGALQLSKFDQTLAMEDATLYIAKQHATGKPVDKFAAQVYDLALNSGLEK